MKYNDLIRDMSNTFNLRLEMVRFAKEHGVSETSREFKTTRKTVRKWRARYEREHTKGLLDRSRAPHHLPHKMEKAREDRIVELRGRHKKWGPKRLKPYYGLEESEGAIYRVLKQRDLIRKRRKKWQRRQDLREQKAKMRVFQKVQTDTKDLQDIPEYYPYLVNEGLPKFKYSTREMSTGAVFFAYADENNGTYAALHARRVIDHLKRYGVEVKEMEQQTDNGSEYIGNVRKKERSSFEKVLDQAKVTHLRIPPRHCTWQSDVERFNGLIEEEFLMCESFEKGEEDFLAKSYAYQLFFNYARKNRWRDNKSPVEILREKIPEMDEQVFNFPPIRLEKVLATVPLGGYHVPDSVITFPIYI